MANAVRRAGNGDASEQVGNHEGMYAMENAEKDYQELLDQPEVEVGRSVQALEDGIAGERARIGELADSLFRDTDDRQRLLGMVDQRDPELLPAVRQIRKAPHLFGPVRAEDKGSDDVLRSAGDLADGIRDYLDRHAVLARYRDLLSSIEAARRETAFPRRERLLATLEQDWAFCDATRDACSKRVGVSLAPPRLNYASVTGDRLPALPWRHAAERAADETMEISRPKDRGRGGR